MRQFVPMTDDLLYDPDNLPGPLVPYQCGMPCLHGLRGDIEIEAARPQSGGRDAEVSASR